MSTLSADAFASDRPTTQRTSRRVSGSSSATLVFAHIAFLSCIILQRFAIPLGSSSKLSICLPIFWMLTVWMLMTGRATLAGTRSLPFIAFVAWTLISAITAVLSPDPRVGFSLLSLLNVLFLYLPTMIRPAKGFDGAVVRDTFLFYARICAAFGIAQFMLQFVGIRIFSFGKIVPALNPFLLESGFAWNPLLSYGSSTLRSNGFFLLEPSIFSQVLCLAILIDLFIVGRWRWLPLYAIAYMASFSGTGLLTLSLTLALVGLTSLRHSVRVIGLGLLAVLIAGIFAILLPHQFGTFAGRFGELGSSNTSGYHRYVAPLAQVQAFADSMRMLIGYGPGSTTRSVYFTNGTGNPAVQLFVDYGLVGLFLFFIYMISSIWSKKYAAVAVLLLLEFELGGGYLLFNPFIILLTTLGVWMSAELPTAPLRRSPWTKTRTWSNGALKPVGRN